MDAVSISVESTVSDFTLASIGSTQENKKNPPDKGFHFTEDDGESNPIYREIQIQNERLTSIIDEAILKSKLVISLPRLIKDHDMLREILPQRHLEDLLLIYRQCHMPGKSFSINLLNAQAIEDIKAGDFSIRNRLSPELAHIVLILFHQPLLKAKAEEITEKELRSQEMACGVSPAILFLKTLQRLRMVLLRRLTTTAAEQLGMRLRMGNIAADIKRLKREICVIKSKTTNEKALFEKHMIKKRNEIDDLTKKLEISETQSKSCLRKIVLDSERRMVLSSRRCKVEMEVLNEEKETYTDALNSMLERNMSEEKLLRTRRGKVETQLASWVQKYNVEMKDKQLELDDITNQYESEAKLVVELESQMAQQDEEYLPLMAEREQEYQQELTDKMTSFLTVHAARVIQYAWRQVLANRRYKQQMKQMAKKAAAASKFQDAN